MTAVAAIPLSVPPAPPDGGEYDSDVSESYSFDLPVLLLNMAQLKIQRHRAIARALGLARAHPTHSVFLVALLLCDPYTQPEELEELLLSVSAMADVLIALTFQRQHELLRLGEVESEDESEAGIEERILLLPTPHFDLAVAFMLVVEHIQVRLKCDSEAVFHEAESAEGESNYKLWTAHGFLQLDLTLLYTTLCVLVLAIYKLYASNENLCLNPFLGVFLKWWKCHTYVVLLGLEMDRKDEANEGPGTPVEVRTAVHGSSAVRAVLASILNTDLQKALEADASTTVQHDFEHITLLRFMNPYARKVASGALRCDIRLYVAAMLSLGSELNDVSELLHDLEPEDMYDEDVRYMFYYDYEDSDEEADEDGEGPHSRPCGCVFPKVDLDAEGGEDAWEDGVDGSSPMQRAPTAVRLLTGDLQFDSEGRDWRDIPRGENNVFDPTVDHLNVMPWLELQAVFQNMSVQAVSTTLGLRAVRTVSWCVKQEFEEQIRLAALGPAARERFEELHTEDPEEVTPDKVYGAWTQEGVFEGIMLFNPAIALAMMDEMLMAHGYRRVLIWFFTHMEVSHAQIDYVHELLTGQRGAAVQRRYRFLRRGPLELSAVERNMLMHEFLGACVYQLGRGPAPQLAGEEGGRKRLMQIVCVMLELLLLRQLLDLSDAEFQPELQTLLIQWVGVLPEARRLFFRARERADGSADDDLLANYGAVELAHRAAAAAAAEPGGVAPAAASTANKLSQDRIKAVFLDLETLLKLSKGVLLEDVMSDCLAFLSELQTQLLKPGASSDDPMSSYPMLQKLDSVLRELAVLREGADLPAEQPVEPAPAGAKKKRKRKRKSKAAAEASAS